MLRLSDLLGRPVLLDGRRVGRLTDLEVGAITGHPPIVALQARRWRGSPLRIPWHPETGVSAERIDCSAAENGAAARRQGLSLRRHLLDVQVIDLAGKRIVRVGDVLLAESDPAPRLVGVEIGAEPVLRRLGLGRFAREREPDLLDWEDLHLPAPASHELQLDVARAEIHRLSPDELAALIARLPEPRAARVIDAAGPRHAGAARKALARRPHRPRFGRVLRTRRHAPS